MISYGEERINMSVTEKLLPSGQNLTRPDSELAVDPETRAKQQVKGMIERFHAFVEGNADQFYAIFVNSETQHVRQHRHFYNELGLSLESIPGTEAKSNVVLRMGNVALVQTIELGADQAPYGVSYSAIRHEL
jgi:hypothetical protein